MIDKTLLIIENDEALVDVTSFYFSEQGYTVYAAFDGTAGVKLALQHKPAVIICDLIMGKMHGFEVLQTLRNHPDTRNMIIIMISSRDFRSFCRPLACNHDPYLRVNGARSPARKSHPWPDELRLFSGGARRHEGGPASLAHHRPGEWQVSVHGC